MRDFALCVFCRLPVWETQAQRGNAHAACDDARRTRAHAQFPANLLGQQWPFV